MPHYWSKKTRSKKSKSRGSTRRGAISNLRKMLTQLKVGSDGVPSPEPAENSFPPLPLTDVQEALFENEGPRFLLDSSTSRRIFRENAKLEAVVPSSEKHGEGSFGYTTSAELHLRGAQGRKFTTVAAFKVIKINPSQIISDGVPYDLVRELGTYVKTQTAESVGKCVFAKLTKDEFQFAMEHYLMDLHRLVQKSMHMSPTEWNSVARALLFQIAHGLKELHAAGVIHKDLKPENVLMAHNGKAIIIDFGLSVYLANGLIQNPQSAYFRRTTVTIQPPESSVDARSVEPLTPAYDIWSLGCCFDYFTTGNYSFDFWQTLGTVGSSGRSAREWTDDVTDRHFKDKVREVIEASRLKGVSEEGIDLLEKMLDLDQTKRPTAAEVVAHPFFKGLTIADATRTIQENLGLGSVTGEKAKNILTRAKRRGDPGAAENTALSAYFQIRPHPPPKPGNLFEKSHMHSDTAPVSRDNVRDTWKYYLNLVFHPEFRVPPYAYLHFLELSDRIAKETGNFSDTHESAVAEAAPIFTLADKACPLEKNHDIISLASLRRIVNYKFNISKDYILNGELTVLKLLHGDMYPLKGGFVERALQLIAEGKTVSNSLARFLFIVVSYIYSPGGTRLDDLFTVARHFSRDYEGESQSALTSSVNTLREEIVKAFNADIGKDVNRPLEFCFFHTEAGSYGAAGINIKTVKRVLQVAEEAPVAKKHFFSSGSLPVLMQGILDLPTYILDIEYP